MFSKMYVLSNSDYRGLIADVLNELGYEEVTKENVKEIAMYIWESFIECEPAIDGFMIYNKNGEWIEIWSIERLEDFIFYEEELDK